jgi:glycerol-3-phosphate dehydrogenase (NAD(P)+)
MIGILGAGAFGTALAVALGQAGREVTLWARGGVGRESPRLPGVRLPETVRGTGDLGDLAGAEALLFALPMQALAGFLREHDFAGRRVACCKGIDLATLQGPTALLGAGSHVLTGPSFADDIARGLPTALTLAGPEDGALQELLSTPSLRLYRSSDPVGAELGGALKNVIAIAAGVVIGAGLGESARAALVTRGFAEMQRLALALGARPETLMGLSGLGDLVLTCNSTQSRNLRFGLALGRGEAFAPGVTVEGAATAEAVARLALRLGVEMPISTMVARLIARDLPLPEAIRLLMTRPLKEE